MEGSGWISKGEGWERYVERLVDGEVRKEEGWRGWWVGWVR